MTGDLEDAAALYHPGNAVIKPLTVGFDPWETHELGEDDNTTNENNVILNCYRAPNYLTSSELFDLSLSLDLDAFEQLKKRSPRCGFPGQNSISLMQSARLTAIGTRRAPAGGAALFWTKQGRCSSQWFSPGGIASCRP